MKTILTSFRFTEEQMEYLRECSKVYGMSMKQYILKSIKYKKGKLKKIREVCYCEIK